MAIQISHLNVSETRNKKRIWIEGKRLAQCGFTKGASYMTVLDVEKKKIILKAREASSRSVSGREKN